MDDNEFIEDSNTFKTSAETQNSPLGFAESLRQELERAQRGYEGFTAEGHENGKSATNRKCIFPRENYRASDIRSSLLIPEKYIGIFRAKVREHNGVRAYIVRLSFFPLGF